MAGWGLVGAATAKAPDDLLQELIAGRLQAEELARKRASEDQKAQIALEELGIKQGTLGVSQGDLKLRQGADARAGEKFKTDQTISAEDRARADAERAAAEAAAAGLPERGKTIFNLRKVDKNAQPETYFGKEPTLRVMAPGSRLVDDAGKVTYSAPDRPAGQGSPPAVKYGIYKDETGKIVQLPVEEGAKRGLTPSRMQSDKERQAKGDLQTAVDLIDQITGLGDSTGWRGIGGLKQGSINQWIAGNFGAGDENEMRLRAKIGNLRGDVMHQRLGAALTKQELETAKSYLAGIDQHPAMAKVLLDEYRNFLRSTIRNRGWDVGEQKSDPPPPNGKPTAADLIKKYGGG